MIGLSVLVRKELFEQWRTMRLVIVTVVFLGFGIMSPVFAKYTPELVKALVPPNQLPVALPAPVVADAIAQFGKNVGQILTVAAILLSMGAIATEKERGTAAFILTKPASRAAFVVAKLVGVAATLAIAMAVSGVASYAYTTWLFTAPPAGGYVAMCVLLWLSLLDIAAITLLGSAVTRSSIAAGAIAFAAYIGLAVVSALPTIGPYTPAGLQGPAMQLALGGPVSDLAGPLLVNALIVVGATVLAWLALRRQEL
jgi:ABC-2 type transport system permease protein